MISYVAKIMDFNCYGQHERVHSLGSIQVDIQDLKAADLDEFDFSYIEAKTQPSYTNQESILSEKPTKPKRNSRGRRFKKSLPRRSFVSKGRHVIQHNYHDHSRDHVDFDEFTGDAIGLESPKKKGGVAVPFPLKLHELLEKVEEDGLQHIVSWQPHGRAFVVREPKAFVADLMPRFFRQTKLTSFQRQLNLYGFSRLTRGRDAGGYYHELFLRGKPYLTRRMVRTKIKGTGYKAASNPAMEPDFYHMSPVGPGYDEPTNNQSNISFSNSYTVETNAPRAYVPIVTPISDCGKQSKNLFKYQSTDLDFIPSVPGLAKSDEASPTYTQPFLRPRQHHTKAVKMGNEYFNYMESLKQKSITDCFSSSDDACSRSSYNPSPILFEKVSSEETSIRDEQEDPSQDPLAIFLADMGGDFDDDLVFTSDIETGENNDHLVNNPSIYEV